MSAIDFGKCPICYTLLPRGYDIDAKVTREMVKECRNKLSRLCLEIGFDLPDQDFNHYTIGDLCLYIEKKVKEQI